MICMRSHTRFWIGKVRGEGETDADGTPSGSLGAFLGVPKAPPTTGGRKFCK